MRQQENFYNAKRSKIFSAFLIGKNKQNMYIFIPLFFLCNFVHFVVVRTET